MDDEFDSIDFFAIDKLVENHQAKLQVSQAAPVSPYGKAPNPTTAAQAPIGAAARPPTAALQQQHQQQQQQQQQQSQQQQQQQQQQQPQQQWRHHPQQHQQPQAAQSAISSSHSRPQRSTAQMHHQPQGHHTSQVQASHFQPGMHHGRQQPPVQPSVYTGPKPPAVSTSHAAVGRVSQAAAVALGQHHQSQHQQHQHQQHAVLSAPHRVGSHAQQLQQSEHQLQGVPSATQGTANHQHVAQMQAERDALQQRLNQEQGTNAVLRSSLERKEKERDELQRRVQQLPTPQSHPTLLSSFNMAEAHKQVATLTQQLAFKEEEIQDLKRRCAEKDQVVKPLEHQVQRLQEDRQRIEQELEEANRDRRERGAGPSTSLGGDPNPPLPRVTSPSPGRGRKPASGAASGTKSTKTTGVKRKLAAVLGSPTGTPGGTLGAAPLQTGHAPLPLQSVVNGQNSNRDSQGVPARNSGVAQSNGLPQPAPPSAPQPTPPPYETPTWSRHPYPVSFTTSFSSSSALQQLWLNCPDSFSLLLTPAASLGLSMHPKSRPETHVHRDSHKSMSGATAQLAGALQRHVQALACGNSAASVAMLHDLTTFLESYNLHRSSKAADKSCRVTTAAATAAAGHRLLSQGLSHHHTAGAESAQVQAGDCRETASDAVEAAASAALHVVAVLVANDTACQQVVIRASQPETAPSKADMQGKETKIASLSLEGLHLSDRLLVKFNDDIDGKPETTLSTRTQAGLSQPSSKVSATALSEVLLQLLIDPLPHPLGVHRALACYRVVLAVTPVPQRTAFKDSITSGVLDRLLSQPQHAQQALQMLHLLTQSSTVCQMLTHGLTEGCQPDSITATVHSQDSLKVMPGKQHQQPTGGDSAEAPMEIDADEPQPDTRWSSSALLESLLACLHTPDTPQDSPLHSPPFSPQSVPATASQPPLTTPTTAAAADSASDTQWGLFKTQRLALLVIATLLQQQQQQQHFGLTMHMVQAGQRNSDGGLCHCLLDLVESVTRDTSGSLLSAFTPVANPGRLGVLNPRCLPSTAVKGPAIATHAPDGAANGPAVRAVAAPQRGTATSSASSSAAHGLVIGSASPQTQAQQESQGACEEDVWHEKMRLAQEVLTLVRRILTDNTLGRAGIQDLVSSSAAIRLSLITTTRLVHWSHSESCTSMQSGSLPLPLQQWVSAWGSSSSSSTKIINRHPECRGGIICSSVEDVVYMAKSIRQRVLVQLNHMNN